MNRTIPTSTHSNNGENNQIGRSLKAAIPGENQTTYQSALEWNKECKRQTLCRFCPRHPEKGLGHNGNRMVRLESYMMYERAKFQDRQRSLFLEVTPGVRALFILTKNVDR